MNAKQTLEILKQAKELGLAHIKMDGLEASFTPQTSTAAPREVDPATKKQAEEMLSKLSYLDDLTDEEIRFYNTPYFDELQAKKALHQQKLKEEAMNG